MYTPEEKELRKKYKISKISITELRSLKEIVQTEIGRRHQKKIKNEKKARQERDEKFRGNVGSGDTIRFRYNREEYIEEIEDIKLYGVFVYFEGSSKLIRYHNILEVLE